MYTSTHTQPSHTLPPCTQLADLLKVRLQLYVEGNTEEFIKVCARSWFLYSKFRALTIYSHLVCSHWAIYIFLSNAIDISNFDCIKSLHARSLGHSFDDCTSKARPL